MYISNKTIMLRQAETWAITLAVENKMGVAEMRMLRQVTRRDKIRSGYIRRSDKVGQLEVCQILVIQKLKNITNLNKS